MKGLTGWPTGLLVLLLAGCDGGLEPRLDGERLETRTVVQDWMSLGEEVARAPIELVRIRGDLDEHDLRRRFPHLPPLASESLEGEEIVGVILPVRAAGHGQVNRNVRVDSVLAGPEGVRLFATACVIPPIATEKRALHFVRIALRDGPLSLSLREVAREAVAASEC